MKIAVISDLHLGFRQYGSIEREEDFYNQLFMVRDKINEKGADMVIIAGDLFDKPNPSPAAINAYREGIGNLNADIIIATQGNHTMILRDNHYSIDEFFGEDEICGYYLLKDDTFTTDLFALSESDSLFSKYKDSRIIVDGITYRGNSKIEDFLEVQKKLAEKQYKGVKTRILVVHQSFKEYCGFTGEELSIKDLDLKPYDYVICGHIHSRCDDMIGDTCFIQPGSIERMNTTEALDEMENGKGFYFIDTETKDVSFCQVECPRKFLLGEVDISSRKDLQNHLEEVENVVSKMDVAPIISYKYNNYAEKNVDIREDIGRVKQGVLINRSNIYDKDDEDISLEITDSEIPTVLEAINMAGENYDLTKKQTKLALDLHTVLQEDSESIKGLLDDFYENHFKKKEEKEVGIIDDDMIELFEYFEE